GEASGQYATGTLANPRGTSLPTAGTGENESQSIYGQATYQLTDTLSFTGGLRYTEDSKGWKGTNYTIPGPAYNTRLCNYSIAAPGIDTVNCRTDLETDFDHVSWTASVDWQVTPDALVYLKNSNGYRAGGQNQRGKLPIELQPFDEETVTDW